MKSKAKPAKGSARTKRFDVGGTVGALAGLGTLAYLMSRKKKGEPESSDVAARRASGAYRGGAGTDTTTDTTTDATTDTKPDTPTVKDTAQAEKDRMESSLKTYQNITSGGGGGGDENKPVVRPVVKKKPVVKKTASARTDQGSVTTTGVDAGIAAGNKKTDSNVILPATDTYAGATKSSTEHAAEINKIFKGVEDPNKGKYAGKGKRAVSKAGKLTPDAYKDTSGVLYDVEGNPVRKATRKGRDARTGKKAGGMVKKYASGGSVSSASKRADGIAQRGKTRGKIC